MGPICEQLQYHFKKHQKKLKEAKSNKYDVKLYHGVQ